MYASWVRVAVHLCGAETLGSKSYPISNTLFRSDDNGRCATKVNKTNYKFSFGYTFNTLILNISTYMVTYILDLEDLLHYLVIMISHW